MNQEILDFEYFRDNQLHNVDFTTGVIDIKCKTRKEGYYKYFSNVGSENQDGYVRLWCNRRLRMKHRLLFWLYHGYLPEEVDHDDKIRNNNKITNLISSNRSLNTVNKTVRTFKQLTAKQVHEICKIVSLDSMNITEIAKEFGKSRCQIKAIINKKYWSHISDQYF